MRSDELNELYRPLNDRKNEITERLKQHGFQYTVGYYNGHYRKNEAGTYKMDYYPIPVISVTGFCDLELQFDSVDVTTKLRRTTALAYDYEPFKEYSFEAYGVEDYLADLYQAGDSLGDLRQRIALSGETEIGFSFRFPPDTEGE